MNDDYERGYTAGREAAILGIHLFCATAFAALCLWAAIF